MVSSTAPFYSALMVPVFKRTLCLGLLLFVLNLTSTAQTWNLFWSDEFNGSSINSANWTYDTGVLNVNDEVEYYCAPSSNTAPCDSTNPNAYLDGSGHLIIQALRINSGVAPYSGSWTSARLNSSNLQSFQYGRIESSMSLPLGPGLWPAFWALGTNISTVGWPASGEIDYMENVPLSAGLGPSTISSTLHGGLSSSDCYCGGNGLGKDYTFPSSDANGPDVTTFHTYGAIWSPYMVQDNKTCLGLEFFVNEGDRMWTKADDDLVQQGIRELLHLDLITDAASVEKGYVVRMPKAYPVYDEHYQEHVATMRKWLAANVPNVYPCGRNGMHKYNNQDHSMFTAMLSVENILGAEHDVWGVNVEAEYLETSGDESKSATGRDAPVLPRRALDEAARARAAEPKADAAGPG